MQTTRSIIAFQQNATTVDRTPIKEHIWSLKKPVTWIGDPRPGTVSGRFLSPQGNNTAIQSERVNVQAGLEAGGAVLSADLTLRCRGLATISEDL